MSISKQTQQAVNRFTQSLFRDKQKTGKAVFVSGFFRVLHPGHVRLLRFAKELGDVLVVGVYRCDGDEGQIQDDVRLKLVEALEWVDHAFLLEKSALQDVLTEIQPNFVVKGKEHELKDNREQKVVDSYGGKIIFSSGETSVSSYELEQESLKYRTQITKPMDFLQRHHFQIADLKSTLDSFASLKVCVIGDTIVDEYIQCEPLGMSQEDPTLVVRPIESERFIGGAAIVAAHMKSLGAGQVSLYSVLGGDEPADFVREICAKTGVTPEFIVDESRPTTLKQRYRSRNKTLLRVNQLRQHKISQQLQNSLYRELVKVLESSDLLVFSDFSYGVLPQRLVRKITDFCKKRDIMMVADSQCSSQTGDITRFTDTKFISPTEHEARVSLKNNDDGLVVLAEKLRQKAQAEHTIITLAEEGLLIQASEPGSDSCKTDRLPAFNPCAKDNAGAGDCLLAVASMAMAKGASIWQSAYLGSIAAACQVSRIGNTPLSIANIYSELNT